MVTLNREQENLWLVETDLGICKVRGAVLRGRERVVVWDTLAHPRHMAPVLPLLRNRELVVVYSHADWDHVWGTGGLPAPVEIVAHGHCARRFEHELPAELRHKQKQEPGVWDEVRLAPPTLTFASAHTLDLGGLSLELHHLPGHTPDSVLGWVEPWGLLLAGDAVELPLPCTAPDSPLGEWITGLESWAVHAGVKKVIPAHGPMGGPEIPRHTAAYLRRLAGGLEPQVPQGLSPFYMETHQDNLRHAGLA